MTAIETLKQWFSNLKKPTQEQFWAWLDSFWHKSEKIPMASVEGLDKLVEGTASAEQLSNHLNDTQAHKVLFDKKVDKVEGKELSSNDFTNEYKEKLDTLQPFVEDNKLKALKELLKIYEDEGIVVGIGFEDEKDKNIAIIPKSSDFLFTFDRFEIASDYHVKIGGGQVIIGSMGTEGLTDYSEIFLRNALLRLRYKNIEFDCPEEKRLVTNAEVKALESRIAALEAKG